jgi:hypothetical protein
VFFTAENAENARLAAEADAENSKNRGMAQTGLF